MLNAGKIRLEFLRELVDGMVESGQAEWANKSNRVQALLYWLKPEEWANLISNWVADFFESR
jgi:ESCRT-II complex subunit VPS25